MKFIKTSLLFIVVLYLTGCASNYKTIQPRGINYISTNENDGISLQYRYDLLDKKYEKKEEKNGVKLVAIKITNNSDQDLIFGKDVTLEYENGNGVYIMENEKVFKTLKQSPASFLWYLLLTPLNLYTTKTNSYGLPEQTSSTPIGLILGPGLAGGNMIAAGSANKKLKAELLEYNISGTVIEKGETKYGLIGIRTDTYDALKLKIQ
ncbi:MAG TPA: hypothetical protein DEF18_13180 [Muricauda sp.]|uniref:Lipoprotein n=1 Tax=Flagellimonas aurea TaxID=2915619 RepID=A0ABS3G3Z9_9FLAO|nr:hypothetical protein [Allomuricauda aurea]MAO16145.1 hypothetical protein [Allomuricauda sp.]MBC73848.1 hypothetical protein [Allomuricauda sp.]MBO0354149.1 hypothetical protein [Allomuricauda aurea]HBU79047.1 hypothetical protein [Allomuricauda sp.]|tara:strand:+ start:413 stop:1033 length:621 start_codon:yes stop_codon:yes gene_type:complete